ncbi:MAG: ADP-ribosylglycohydrolase family protein, partial [Planctomycetota bacterium]
EFWDRGQIAERHGDALELWPSGRPAEAEGLWIANAPPGTTTDDTRWKRVLIDHLVESKGDHALGASAENAHGLAWARRVCELDMLAHTAGNDAVATRVGGFDDVALVRDWLAEWARVADAYSSDDVERYSRALGRFYGGDLACAGMMYAPVLGALYPGDPASAYAHAFELSIFDLGYARDIAACTAAMTAAAMAPGATVEDVVGVLDAVDPEGFSGSRLIGRVARSLLDQAREVVGVATQQKGETAQVESIYARFDRLARHNGFHAGEVHLVNLTALLWSDGDFERAMRLVVRYGRDNDSAAAVTGAVLGALRGAAGLPSRWVEPVEAQSRSMGMSLDALGDSLCRLSCG